MALPEEEDDGVAEFLETCSSTLLSGLPSPPWVVGATVMKEEPEEEDQEEKGADSVVVKDNRRRSSSSSMTMGFVGMPKPMEGLNEAGPPPFLRKTYEMVDDPETDDLVSWSSGGSSFLVWDQPIFSRHLLPKYFKHRNFSSFIRQLNTYGFKKIDRDRWEFAIEGFQRGKRHLLKSINRRARNNERQLGSPSAEDKRAAPYESNDLEILRNDQDALRGEVVKLRQQEEDLHSVTTAMEERIRCTELRQQNMFLFLSKAVKNQTYLEKLMEKRKRSTAELIAADAMTRKRKLQEISGPEANLVPIRNSDQAVREVLITGDMSPGSLRVALPEALGVNQGRNGPRDILPEKSPEQYSQDRTGQSSYDNEAMSGDSNGQSTAAKGGGEEENGVDHGTIYLELDNLVEKPFGWELRPGSDLKEQTQVSPVRTKEAKKQHRTAS